MEINFALVGQRIRQVRKLRGWSVEALAEQVGLATESLRHIETAVSKPRLQTLYRIAGVLDVSMDYITGRTKTRTDNTINEYGLNADQEKMVLEILESIVPIVIDHT